MKIDLKSARKLVEERINDSWSAVGGILILLGFVAFFVLIPGYTDFHSGPRQNESAAIGGLRAVNALETQYAATHPGQGFACALSTLKTTGKNSSQYEPTEALVTGVYSGYKFEIVSCETDAHGVVNHYRVSAVPLKRAETGIRAFCSDESEQVFQDPNGSAANCLINASPYLTVGPDLRGYRRSSY